MLVECHSDSDYADRPTALYWNGQRLEVEAVEQQWRTPEGKWFRVRTKDGQVFELGYIEAEGEWRITLLSKSERL